MHLNRALILSLGELAQPVVTQYQLAVRLLRLCAAGIFQGESIIDIPEEPPDTRFLNELLVTLTETGLIDPYPGFPSHAVFRLPGSTAAPIADIACSVDPFCFLSHLSAMEHHGLTNRLPTTLYLSSPSTANWTMFARERMQSDLGDLLDDYLTNRLPRLRKPRFEKINKTPVHRHDSSHLGAYINIRNRALRVSSIGRTFLDMLRAPDLCGGINHVIEVFDEHAEIYLDLIIGEVTRHGRAIDQVRAGYLLEERMGLTDDRFALWHTKAQRGGSRKLDPGGEYAPKFSETWQLSINAFLPEGRT